MLKAQSLSYRLQDKNLIHDISLDFHPGVLYGILGPNGSGKSTLLKTLAGIWKKSSGEVLWHGRDLLQNARKEISKTISLVPQNAQLYFEFSVSEVVMMGRYPHRSKFSCKKQESEMLEWALTIVDAWHLRQRLVCHLSNGERQRVYIARALMTESPILLLDEPTASLDIKHQLEIWQLLRDLLQRGKVIIVTNHDLTSVERYCDQIAVINQGRCIAAGIFSDVMTPQLIHEVFGVVEQTNNAMRNFVLPEIPLKKVRIH